MAKRRLLILGQTFDAVVDDAVGSVGAIFEAARAIAEPVAEIARGRERAQGRAVSCAEGCSACCFQLVPISTLEAAHLAEVIAALPRPRREAIEKRFASAVKQMEKAGLLDPKAPRGRIAVRATREDGESPWDAASRSYEKASIACPLLEQKRCTLYAARPLVCREYAVTSPPAYCSDRTKGDARGVPRPTRMSEALGDVALAIAYGGETEIGSIPLPLALEWVAARRPVLDAEPKKLAQTLLDAIEIE